MGKVWREAAWHVMKTQLIWIPGLEFHPQLTSCDFG